MKGEKNMSIGCYYIAYQSADTTIPAYWIDLDLEDEYLVDIDLTEFKNKDATYGEPRYQLEVNDQVSIVTKYEDNKLVFNLELSESLQEIFEYAEGDELDEDLDYLLTDYDIPELEGWNRETNKPIFNVDMNLSKLYEQGMRKVNEKTALCRATSSWTYSTIEQGELNK
jgi:hypothetical protein